MEELGELLGIDSDGSNGSEEAAQTESTLDVPNITQREEAPVSTPSGSTTPRDEFAMNANFEPHEFLAAQNYWGMDAFGFNVTPTGGICPTGNCEFEFEDGQIRQDSSGDWVLTGRLKVGVETDEGIRSKL